ncbi:MAG TPA: hypothetical protein VD766_08680 [Solirubrobacterales bacterium]|nr:hypothetical protein [Solirubrobacterales bacterium]
MSESLATTIAVYGLGLSAWSMFRAFRRTAVDQAQTGAAVVFGIASAGQAIAAVIELLGGHETSNTGVLVAYLGASVGILPLVWPLAMGDEPRWGQVTLALAFAAASVVALRAFDVWQG